jgi:hypothetical protein
LLTQARDVKVMSDEAKAAATEKTRELLLARESVIAAGRRADALLSKRSAQLLELSLVVGVV